MDARSSSEVRKFSNSVDSWSLVFWVSAWVGSDFFGLGFGDIHCVFWFENDYFLQTSGI